MSIKVGDKVPAIDLLEMTESGPAKISSAELFGGRKIAFLALPGAFTPTCSAKHLPGFVDNSDALKAKGFDEIVCLSVNDPFVMRAWAENQNVAGKVRLVADWDGSFTKAMGLEFDASGAGLGIRSRRYSMIVEDGAITCLNIEEAPGAFEVSSAEKMLEQA